MKNMKLVCLFAGSLACLFCCSACSKKPMTTESSYHPEDNAPVTGAMYFNLTEHQVLDLKEKVDAGSGEAALRLSNYYEMVKLDHSTGIVWLKKAAALGSSTAQYNLAILYSYDDSIKDLRESRHWMEEAAKNGDNDAIKALKNGSW